MIAGFGSRRPLPRPGAVDPQVACAARLAGVSNPQQNTLGQEGTAGAPSNNKKKNQLLQQNEQNGGNQPQIMKKKQLQQQNTQGQEVTGGAASNKKKNQLLQQNEQGQQLGGQNQNQNQNQNKKAKKNCVPGTENCPG